MHSFFYVLPAILFLTENFFEVFIRIDKGFEDILKVGLNLMVDVVNVLKLSKCVLTGVLFGMNFNAVGAHGEQARGIFTEIYNKLFGMEGTVGWLHGENRVNGKRNYNRNVSIWPFIKEANSIQCKKVQFVTRLKITNKDISQSNTECFPSKIFNYLSQYVGIKESKSIQCSRLRTIANNMKKVKSLLKWIGLSDLMFHDLPLPLLHPGWNTAHASTIKTISTAADPLSEGELIGVQNLHVVWFTEPTSAKNQMKGNSSISLAKVDPPTVPDQLLTHMFWQYKFERQMIE